MPFNPHSTEIPLVPWNPNQPALDMAPLYIDAYGLKRFYGATSPGFLIEPGTGFIVTRRSTDGRRNRAMVGVPNGGS